MDSLPAILLLRKPQHNSQSLPKVEHIQQCWQERLAPENAFAKSTTHYTQDAQPRALEEVDLSFALLQIAREKGINNHTLHNALILRRVACLDGPGCSQLFKGLRPS